VALDVSRNRLEGTIPATYKNCASLQVLNVGDNLLSGPIQCLDEFTSLKSLRYLSLEGNSFHGFLSVSFSDLPKLRVLNLSRNQLAGAVPRGLAQVIELDHPSILSCSLLAPSTLYSRMSQAIPQYRYTDLCLL